MKSPTIWVAYVLSEPAVYQSGMENCIRRSPTWAWTPQNFEHQKQLWYEYTNLEIDWCTLRLVSSRAKHFKVGPGRAKAKYIFQKIGPGRNRLKKYDLMAEPIRTNVSKNLFFEQFLMTRFGPRDNSCRFSAWARTGQFTSGKSWQKNWLTGLFGPGPWKIGSGSAKMDRSVAWHKLEDRLQFPIESFFVILAKDSLHFHFTRTHGIGSAQY